MDAGRDVEPGLKFVVRQYVIDGAKAGGAADGSTSMVDEQVHGRETLATASAPRSSVASSGVPVEADQAPSATMITTTRRST